MSQQTNTYIHTLKNQVKEMKEEEYEKKERKRRRKEEKIGIKFHSDDSITSSFSHSHFFFVHRQTLNVKEREIIIEGKKESCMMVENEFIDDRNSFNEMMKEEKKNNFHSHLLYDKREGRRNSRRAQMECKEICLLRNSIAPHHF